MKGQKFTEGVDYELGKSIGRGGFGEVYEIMLLDSGKRRLGIKEDNFLCAKIVRPVLTSLLLCGEKNDVHSPAARNRYNYCIFVSIFPNVGRIEISCGLLPTRFSSTLL